MPDAVVLWLHRLSGGILYNNKIKKQGKREGTFIIIITTYYVYYCRYFFL